MRPGAQKKWDIDHIFGQYTEISVAGRGWDLGIARMAQPFCDSTLNGQDERVKNSAGTER